MNKDKIKNFFKGFVYVLWWSVVLVCGVKGAVDFYQDNYYCVFIDTGHYEAFNVSFVYYGSYNNIKVFANSTGFFGNGFILEHGQSITNCSLKRKKL